MANSYKLGVAEPKKLLLGLRTPQVVILAIAVGFSFLLATSGNLLLVLPVLGVAAAATFLPFAGRSFDEWIPIFAKWILTGSNRNYSAAAPLLGHSDKQTQVLSPPPFLKGVKLLKVTNKEGIEVAVVKDGANGTYSAAIEIRGGSFVLSNQDEQDMQLANWGSVLARFAREGTVLSRVQWIERAIPENAHAMHNYYDETGTLDENDPVASAYLELIDGAAPVTTAHEAFLVVQISQSSAGKAIKQAGGGDEGACEVLLRELTHAAGQVSSAGFSVLKAIDRNNMVRLIRTTFEPGVNESISKRLDQGLTSNEIWPMTAKTEWDYYQTDSALHRTFWISDFPRTEVGADFMAPLMLQSLITRTISVIMEPISPTKALREVEVAKTSFIADQDLRDKAGYVLNATREREFRKLESREQELADGHGAYRFSAYVTCSATNEDELDYVSQSIEQVGHQSRLVLRCLYGEQDVAFGTILPLGRGLL